MQSEMQTEAGRRNPASVKARFSARSFFQWAYATLACSARQLGLCACFFLLPFVRWFGIPSPFAAALLLGLNRPPEVFSLLGLMLSLTLRLLWGVESDPWQYAGLFFLWLLLRRSRPRPGIETAALGGAAMMPRAIQSLFTGEPLTMLLSLAAVPVCMAISAWFRDGLDRTGFAPPRFRDKAVRIFLGLLLISGLGYFQLFGVSLGQAGAVLGTLLAAGQAGCAAGAAGGLFCGLALAFGGHDCRIAFSLSLCGLLCGVPFLKKKRPLGMAAAFAGNLLSFFVTPLTQPTLGWLAVALGGLCYVLLPKSRLDEVRELLCPLGRQSGGMDGAFLRETIGRMQESIRSVAKALPQVAETIPSEGLELGELLCAQCSNRELCWGRARARTEKLMSSMMERSRQGEPIEEDALPALSQQGCLRAESIPEAAQEALTLHQQRLNRQKRARYERELTLTHLAAMLGSLSELNTVAAGESLNDLQAAHVIRQAMDELHVPAQLLYARRVDGHLQAALQAEAMFPIQKPLEALLRRLDQEEQLPLSISRAEKGHIELEELPLYSASIGTASVCAGQRDSSEGDGICGDASAARRCDGGRLLLMLCDGMGHGKEAHDLSEKTLELLLLLMEAGYTRRQAITAVNGIMLSQKEQPEGFSTVDLADVDLWTGDVALEKLGACASWLIRGDHVKKLEASSLPLGVMEEARSTSVECRLHSGDILVMLSDGISDVFPDEAQMRKMLEESVYIQPQRMADALIRNAILASGGTPRDDMTAQVLLLMTRQQG